MGRSELRNTYLPLPFGRMISRFELLALKSIVDNVNIVTKGSAILMILRSVTMDRSQSTNNASTASAKVKLYARMAISTGI